VIVFENKDVSKINARSAPTFTALGRRYARLTNYFAVTHPSLPNYLALVSGSTHGITNDCTTCSIAGESIGDQLTRAGRSWVAYAEGYQSGTGFAKKHVPFLYFRRGAGHVRPLSQFDPHSLPEFAFVVPNLCHDMHDCSVATGDAWLKRFATALLPVPDTVVFVVFDEGTRGNHVAALALGTAVRPQSVFSRRVDHYGLLRTIEEMWDLPLLGAAAQARTIDGIWK
jgi:acid phosphatase